MNKPLPISGKHVNEELLVDTNDFVYDSIVRRLVLILDTVCINNKDLYDDHIISKIKELSKLLIEEKCVVYNFDLLDGTDKGPNWIDIIEQVNGKELSCLQVPWFYLENLIYRILLSIIDYYNVESKYYKKDPFFIQKQGSLEKCLNEEPNIYLNEYIDNNKENDLATHLRQSLWSNRADLSISGGKLDTKAKETIDAHLIINNIDLCIDYIVKHSTTKSNIVVIIDNCGPELVQDLRLIDFILTNYDNFNIILHVKEYPVFVSDGMEIDVMNHIKLLENLQVYGKITIDHVKYANALSLRLQIYLNDERLIIKSSDFYCSGYSFEHAPKDLLNDYKNSILCIIKGDANYRRLLGDLSWSPFSKFEEIIEYMPTSVLCLRTCKSPIIVGLTLKEQINKLREIDSKWLLNGKFGLIQCYIK